MKRLGTEKGTLQMIRLTTRFLRDTSGMAAVEYGFIAALIALMLAAGAASMGNSIGGFFNSAGDTVHNSAQ
jgi:Flp pilus assembly pilin Flp